MAVTTKKVFPATTNTTTTTFGPIGIELNNQDDLDVYITEAGGTRVLQLKQSTASTADGTHPQVNDTTGLYFPPVTSGTSLKNYLLSADNNNIIFNSALPNGAVVTAERRTRDESGDYTAFSAGSTMRSTDLNTAFDEVRFTAQEGRNKAYELENQLDHRDITIGPGKGLEFEGSTVDGNETKLVVVDPTADRTVTIPDQSGNVIVSGNATIVDADINPNASIAVSKLRDGWARQILQTDAAGTGVEWTSNVDIGGTLDVTSSAAFDSNVTVTGTTTLNGNTTIGAAATVTGDTTFNGNVAHTGTGKTFMVGTSGAVNKFTVASSTGNVHTVGTLGIDGDFDVATDKFTVAAATGNTVIAGNLDVTGTFDVTGTSNYTGQQTVPGGALVKNIRVGLDGSNEVSTSNGNLVLDSANGTVQVTDHLNVTGSADVDVNLNVDGTLTVDGVSTLTGNVSVGGTVDGRDIAADGTKLDGIEAGATGDQTNAEIRAAVEAASDSNVFTDADHTKLNAIEAGATADQTNAEIRAAVEAATDSNVFTDADHSKLNAIEANATADQTAAEIRTLVEAASDSNVFTDADHSKLNAIEAGATADQTSGEIKTLLASDNLTAAHLAANSVGTSEIADNAVTADKIADAAIVTNSEQGSHSANDTTFYTTAASDARYYNIGSLEEIQSGETWAADDAKIATTAAIDARIVDLVDDVGGFVPIANETSFPNANPDVNNGSGTLVSIKALASNLTSNGSGVATISNGTVGNSTVTINGLANSTTYPAGRGILVETTSTLNTYTFHRQLAEATATTTVANSISNVNTCATNISNINAVAADATDIGVVAGKETEIGRLGTADAVADMNTLATTAIVADMDTLADISSNITTVAGISSNVTAVAGNATNINAVAGNATNINAVAADAADIGAVAGKATEIGRLGTADAVADLAILGTADAVADMNTLATSDIVSDMNTLATSANVTAMDNCSDDIANINTVAGSISNVNTTATNIANVNTVGNNIGTVNDFAARYRGPQSNANEYTTSLDVGDLYFNTDINALKVYTGSAWVAGVTQTGDYALTTGSTYTGNNTHNDNVKSRYGTGNDLEIYHASGDNQIKSVNGKVVITTTAGNADIEITPHGSGVVKLDGLSWPTADGSSSQYLKTNGSGVLSWGTVATDVVADTTPQLGGNLDTNGKNIVFGDSSGASDDRLTFGAGNDLQIWHDAAGGNYSYIFNYGAALLKIGSDQNIVLGKTSNENYIIAKPDNTVELYYDNVKKLETTSSGILVAGNVDAGTGNFLTDDNGKYYAGTGGDLSIYHDGTNSNIINTTGDLYIQTGASKGIYIRPNNGENGIVVNPDAAVDLYYNNARKLRTRADGISIVGDNDGIAATYYYADDGDDDTDTWATFAGTTGAFYLKNQTSISSNTWETAIKANSNAGVELYYNNSKKLQTYSNGTEIVGNLWLQSGGSYHNDNVVVNIGSNNDLKLYHNASNSVIKHDGTGDFYVMTEGSNEDIYVRATGDVRLQTAGSENAVVCTADGAVELYYDNSKKFNTSNDGGALTGNLFVSEALQLNDSKKIELGNGQDLQIKHDGTNSLIQNSTGYLGLQSDTLYLQDKTNGHAMITAVADGAVGLRYDNVEKLATKSDGINVAGSLYLNGADNYKIKFGASDDMSIYHDGNNSVIKESGQGDLRIQTASFRLRNEDASAMMISADAGSSVYLAHNGTTKLQTESWGVDVTGTVQCDQITLLDNEQIRFGTGADLKIYHDGSHSYIQDDGTGELRLRGTTIRLTDNDGSENFANFNDNGSVDLYYDNSKKFETTSTGATLTGDLTVTNGNVYLGTADTSSGHINAKENMTFNIDTDNDDTTRTFKFGYNGASGSNTNIIEFNEDRHVRMANDVGRFKLGASDDLQIYHDGSNSRIHDGGTGILAISGSQIDFQNAAQTESLLQAFENGRVTLRYDNSTKLQTESWGVRLEDELGLLDNKKIYIGNSNDLQIWHSGSHSYIQDSGTGNLAIGADDLHLMNAATTEYYIKCTTNGAVELYHDNGKRFETTSDGAIVGGNSSVSQLLFKTNNGADQRAKIQTTNGNEVVFFNGGNERIWDYDNNGEFAAYYDNSKKLKTTSGGIDVTGAITVNGAALPSGTCLGFAYTSDATHRTYSGSWGDSGLSINYVCQNSSSKILIQAAHNMFASPVQSTGSTTWGKGKVRINVDGTIVGEEMQYVVGLGHSGYYSHYAAWKSWQFHFTGVYSNGSTGNKNFKTQLYENSGVLEMNKEAGTSWLTVTEYDA